MTQKTVLQSYYGATLIFLLIDVVFGLSIRAAFLDAHTAFRMGYYAFCMGCFILMVWKPALTMLIGAVESAVTLASLIIVMGLRVMVPTDQMLETGGITVSELVNFMIAGGIAYIAGLREYRRCIDRQGNFD